MATARTLHLAAARTSDLASVRAFVDEHARGVLAEVRREDLVQAVDEMATNVLVHGYARQPGPLTVELEHDRDRLVVRLLDEAPAFDPHDAPAPALDLPLAARRPGGFGVHLTRGAVDEMHHRARGNGVAGNELTLVMRVGGEGAGT